MCGLGENAINYHKRKTNHPGKLHNKSYHLLPYCFHYYGFLSMTMSLSFHSDYDCSHDSFQNLSLLVLVQLDSPSSRISNNRFKIYWKKDLTVFWLIQYLILNDRIFVYILIYLDISRIDVFDCLTSNFWFINFYT